MNGNVLYVQDIDALQALTGMPDGQAVQITDTGRSGLFRWDPSDQSAQVASDPMMGIYVPPLGQDGSQGGWSRVLHGEVRPEWFGAGSHKSPEDNKTIIESIVDAAEGPLFGIKIIVSDGCEYGYRFTDASTHISKSNPASSCVIEDFTHGPMVNSGGLYSYGGQRRLWMFAEGLVEQNEEGTGIGNTAGNSTLIHGLWNPGLVLQMNGENADNRRVKLFFGARGENFWSLGQGNQTIEYDSGAPAEISGSNEKRRRHFNVSGKTNDVTAYQNKWVIRQDNGHQGWNIAEPSYTYHFTDNPNVSGTMTFMIEHRADQSAQLVIRTGSEQVNIVQDNSSGGRLLFQNTAGETILQIGSDGEVFPGKALNPRRYTTTERNDSLFTASLSFGAHVFDRTLGMPIWWDSPGVWKDASGNTV